MFFLFFLIISCTLLFLCGRAERKYQLLLFSLFSILWVLFIGGQYNVGTDYFSYKRFVVNESEAEYVFADEPVFNSLLVFSRSLSSDPQVVFFVVSLIMLALFATIMRESIRVRDSWLFLFLFITMSTVFNNQFNAVRQYLATYMASYALLLLYNKKYYWGGVFVLLGIFTHAATKYFVLVALALYFLSYLKWTPKTLVLLLIVSVVLSFLLSSFQPQINAIIAKTDYAYYLEKDYFRQLSLQPLLSKLVFLPLYMLAIYDAKEYLTTRNEKIFVLGVFFYCMRIVMRSTSITNRFGMFFDILLVLPICYYLSYAMERKKVLFPVAILFLLVWYFVKTVIFAKGEYVYDSIFFY